MLIEVWQMIDIGYNSLIQRSVEIQMMAVLIGDHGFPNAIYSSLKNIIMSYFNANIKSYQLKGHPISTQN